MAGYLHGLPKRGTSRLFVDEIGQEDLGEEKNEAAPGAIAALGQVKLDQSLLK